MKYEKPALEEMELILEGSFLDDASKIVEGLDTTPWDGDF